jgi:two-component system, LuxR family, sensor kinase FixL
MNRELEEMAEAAGLASRDAQMRAILEAAVDGIISINEQGIIQTINPAAERMFGYAADEMMGRNIKLLMPAPYRDDHDGYLTRYLSTGQKRIIGIGREAVGLRKDGTTFPLELSVAEARVGRGRIFAGIVRDITERKRAEEARFHLAAIVESSEEAIISKTLDGTISSWNAGAERLYGYAAAEVKGRSIQFLIPPEHPEELPSILQQIANGGNVRNDTVRIRKDGQRIDVALTVSPIRNALGQVVGASAIGRDITVQKQINEEIRAMTQQLWHAAKLASVGELAASIAHELNNPLATVSLRIESLLSRTPAGDPRRKALDIVAQETQRMGDLVANLLQFSRRGVEQVSTVDVREELTRAVELIHHHLRKRSIVVSQDFAPETGTIYADRQKLRQVFLNLLSNASDAMPTGGTLTLRTTAAALPSEQPAVQIEVVDTGVGILPEHLERVMEPFFTTKEEGKGTGLGLAICRRVVQEHNGTIQIVSAINKGSTVRIVLPVTNATNVGHLRSAGAAK